MGIVIDKFLIWDEHVRNLCSKLSCRVGLLKKLSYFLPRKVLLLLYYSLIHYHIEYLCIAWGSACKVHLKPLQVLQSRVLKFIFNLSMQFPSEDLYFKTKILPIKGIFNLQCVLVKDILAEKCFHNIVLQPICHDHDTRNSTNLYFNASRINVGKNKITCIGPDLFNHLPMDLQDPDLNIYSFKRKLKAWLLEASQTSKLSKLESFYTSPSLT